MKFNLSITLTLLLFIGSHVALSQKRGKKGKSTSSDMLNMTFERLQEDEEVSELGSITLLDNGVFSPTENAADLFQKGAGSVAGIPNNAWCSLIIFVRSSMSRFNLSSSILNPPASHHFIR